MKTQQSLTWNLSDLYSGLADQKIGADFAECRKLAKKLETFRGKITKLKPQELLKLITTWEEQVIILSRVSTYAGLFENTHIGEAEATRFLKSIEEQVTKERNRTLFIDVELAQTSEDQWQQYLKAPELKPYQKFLTKAYQYSKHTLSEAEEKILNEKNQTSAETLAHLFSMTTDTLSTKFEGKTINLDELIHKMSDPNSKIREKAAAALHKLLNQNSKTTPAILNALVKDKAITDELRGYQYPEQLRYLDEDVEPESVEAMIKAITASYEQVKRYYTIKNKVMGVKTLYWWDRYAPLPKTGGDIPIEEAKTMVIDAFDKFSPELSQIVRDIIDKEHIDWLPSAKKRGGAYCAFGDNKAYPYILLNYTGGSRDVMTLAHELGHGVHDVLANRENVFFETHPSLALAEIASTFGESLLFDALTLNKAISQEDRISLLMSFIEDRFATVYRQATMFQFEQALHQKRAKEGELSKEQLDDLWHETMKKPFEGPLIYTDSHKNSWMYVAHVFLWPFYVFTYAFAQLCSLALYRQYKEQGSGFAPKYLEILKSGGSLSPKDNLARAGFDISKPEFWQQGLKVIEEYIDLLEKEIR